MEKVEMEKVEMPEGIKIRKDLNGRQMSKVMMGFAALADLAEEKEGIVSLSDDQVDRLYDAVQLACNGDVDSLDLGDIMQIVPSITELFNKKK